MHRILIVENELIVSMELESRLQELGYEVAGKTGNGNQAVALAAELKPDLVLMDIMLDNDTDGVLAAKSISESMDVPIIFLTSHSDQATLNRAKSTSPFGYIIKPFDERDLRVTIEMALHKHAADKKIRYNENLLNITFNSIADAIVVLDSELRITFMNQKASELCNREFTGLESAMPFDELFEISNPSCCQLADTSIAFLVQDCRNCEIEVKSYASHQTGIFELTISELSDAQTDRSGFVVLLHDISERVKQEKELKRLSSALSQAEDIVLITNESGVPIYCNDAFKTYTGIQIKDNSLYEVREKLRTIIPNFTPAESVTKALNGDSWEGVLDVTAVENHTLQIQTRFTPVRDQQKNIIGCLVIGRDMTREINLEEQLRQSQKLEGIGQLAGGIAHDFNNLLTVINGYTEFAASNSDNKDIIDMAIQEIEKAGKRASDLTSRLLAFSRKQIIDALPLKFSAVVKDLNAMLSRLIGDDIAIQITLPEHEPFIQADMSQLQHILINLAVNARDAIRESNKPTEFRRISISAETLHPDNEYLSRHPEVTQIPFLKIKFADSGTGIDKETMAKIFEPFFTTKSKGKGTGLGLASVYGTIKQNNGFIYVDSVAGEGTTFEILWPVIADVEINGKKVKEKGKNPSGGTEHILVVEDDENVLTFSSSALTALGYSITSAVNGSDALQLLEAKADTFDLIFTDMIMPVMDGAELARHVNAKWPDLPILFTTGFTDEPVVRSTFNKNNAPFLLKPFSIKDLSVKIREVLGN